LTADEDSETLDDAVRFRVNGVVLDSTQAVFDDGTWTITGISTSDLAGLEILYHDYEGTIDVGIQTVDGTDTLGSEITGSFDLRITPSHDIDLSSETTDMDIIATEGAFQDTIISGSGDDYIDAGAGRDVIDAGAGNDTIDGGNAKDTINGGAGNDTIYGGAGDDVIDGGTGSDLIDGGDGYDTILLSDGISSLDFSKLTDIEEIDLTNDSADTITNLTLDDVVEMTDSDNELKITGDDSEGDSVTFKEEDGWTKDSETVVEDGITFDVYTNSSDDETVKVKVQADISDGITS